MDIQLKPPVGGNCHGKTELFFSPPHKTRAILAKEREAVAICGMCQVRNECLTYALHHEKYGIWGGKTEAQRDRLRKERNIKLVQISPFGGQRFI